MPPRSAVPTGEIAAGDLEVATLSRTNGRRCFERVTETQLTSLLAD